jgi:ParB-like chromosome segregation protein Spo0J
MTVATDRRSGAENPVSLKKQLLIDAIHARLRPLMLKSLEGKDWQSVAALDASIPDEDAARRNSLGCERNREDPVENGRVKLRVEMFMRLFHEQSIDCRNGKKGLFIRLMGAAAAGAEGRPTLADAPPAPAADPPDRESAAQPAVAAAAPPPPVVGGDVIVHLPVRGLRAHRAARDVPDMRDEEWRPFLADVQARGVQEPLVVQKGGVVLDGRHRLNAAKESGHETVPARLVDLSDDEQEAYVYRAVLLRRHLSDDQRAVLAVRWTKAQMKAARLQSARKAGKASGRSRRKAVTNVEDNASSTFGAAEDTQTVPAPRAREKAAAEFSLRERKVRVANELETQSPELAAKVLAGKMTLNQARRDLKATASKKEGATAPKGKPRGLTSEANGAHGKGVETAAGVKPQESPTEPGEAEVEPSTDVGGVGSGPWARWLRLGLQRVDPADLAAELLRELGVEGAAEVRDALTEALKVAAV